MNADTDSSHLAAPSSGRTSVDAAPNAPSAGKRVYAVLVSKETTAMVLAADEDEATAYAESNARDILRDCPQDVIADVVDVVRTQADLSGYGWDEMCLPYGGDGNTRLSDILPVALPTSIDSVSGSPARTVDGQMDNKGIPPHE